MTKVSSKVKKDESAPKARRLRNAKTTIGITNDNVVQVLKGVNFWNIDIIANSAIVALCSKHPTMPNKEKAQALGISVPALYTRAKDLKLDILTIDRSADKKDAFFAQLDNAPMNTNIIFKDYTGTRAKTYCAEWVKEQTKIIGYLITEIESGTCVYLYEKKNNKTRK